MSKSRKLLGTVCVAAAALAAGPVAADTLDGFQGFAVGAFGHTTYSNCGGCDSWNGATAGLGMALPVADIPNLNWQGEAYYTHTWEDHHSQEVWNFAFSPFLAYGGSRWGLNINYETMTHQGHRTNGGGFMEWYINDALTVAAKGGYLSSGGTPQGGHGHYLAGNIAFYPFPNLAIDGAVDWQDVTTGGSSTLSTCVHCQIDYTTVDYSIAAEFLPFEEFGATVAVGFDYTQASGQLASFNATTFFIQLKYYTGMGTLVDRQRGGTLRSFLRGP